MGTEIQKLRLDERGYRGERFADWHRDLKGNNDLLILTRPAAIREIHTAYLDAGADIIETNTFNSTRVAMADYGMEELAAELCASRRATRARSAATRPRSRDGRAALRRRRARPHQPHREHLAARRRRRLPQCFVRRTRSRIHRSNARAFSNGGADLLLVETIFDTLNAKAALFAIEEAFAAGAERVPIMISGTITDQSGRTLSGQTTEAFWNSVAHARPLSVGLNCALGAKDLRAYIQELARVAPCWTSVHPNAGLPNEMGEYDETPSYTSEILKEFAESGFLNIVGGCCGTTPAHIAAIARAVKGHRAARDPRRCPSGSAYPASSRSPSAPTRTS